MGSNSGFKKKKAGQDCHPGSRERPGRQRCGEKGTATLG